MSGYKVTLLEIENYMGVKAARIEPGDLPVIRIEGINGAGKSTVIDSIWADIAAQVGEDPINHDASSSTIFVALNNGQGDKLEVTRRITGKTQRLEVKLNGAAKTSPQALLNELFSRVTMDPEEFSRMRDRERIETLLALTGKAEEIAALDQQAKDAYDERTIVNRRVTEGKVKLAGYPADIEQPVEPVSSGQILERLRAEQSRMADIAGQRQQVVNLKADITEKQRDIENNTRRIKEYEQAIEDLNAKNLDSMEMICKRNDQVAAIETEIAAAPPDKTTEIEAELSTIEATNERARKHSEYAEHKENLRAAEQESTALTNKLHQIEKQKTGILCDNLPFDRLKIEGETIYIKDTPYASLSGSEKIMVGLEIAAKLNPGLRVIKIANGAELDSARWEKVEAFARQHDLQIWTAVVSDVHQNGFYIEEGVVRS
jgi:hypothetical protein